MLITAFADNESEDEDTGDSGNHHIMVWSAKEGLRELSSPYAEVFVSVQTISDTGDIIGFVMDAGPRWSGEFSFILTHDGHITELPTLNPSKLIDGELSCWALGGNELGQIVGAMAVSDGRKKPESLIWVHSGEEKPAQSLSMTPALLQGMRKIHRVECAHLHGINNHIR